MIDEPIVGLDPESVEVTKNVLTDFAKKGGIVLVSTHTLSFVEAIADRVGILSEGSLIFEGKVEDLKRKAKGSKNFTSAFMQLIRRR